MNIYNHRIASANISSLLISRAQRMIVLAAALIMAFALTSTSLQAQILSNSGFESGTTGWTAAQNSGAATFSLVTSPVHSGSDALQTVTTGSPDLALNATATASSYDNTNDLPANATDGNASTRWSSSYNNNQWIYVDLGSAKSIQTVMLVWQTYGTSYDIDVSSDATTWTTVYSTTTGAGGTETINFTPVTARYVRMYGLTRGSQWGFSLYQFSVYSSINLALNATATASSSDNNNDLPANATDGSLSTRWSSTYNDNQWIYVDLGSIQSVQQVVLQWQGTSAYGKSYQIQTSYDASTWTTVYSTTAGVGGVENISFPAVLARYVKMNGLTRGTQWGFSLYEFQVYGGANYPALTHTAFTATTTSTYQLRFWAQSTVNRAVMRAHIVSSMGSYSVDFEPSSAGYDEYNYAFKATGPTTIAFTFEQNSTFTLDDIQVYDQTDTVYDTALTYLMQWGQYNFAQTATTCLTGSDNDIATQLPDGRVAWIYNDSWIGGLNFYSNYRGNGSLPRNYILMQSGSNLTPLTSTTVFNPSVSGDIFWPSDAVVDNGSLQVLVEEVANGGSGPQDGETIYTMALPSMAITGTVARSFGKFILDAGDGFDYIYDGNKVGRVAKGSFASVSSWTYYNGATWVSDYTQTGTLSGLNTAIGSFERLGPNNYAAISYGYLGYTILAQFASNPVGPWSSQVTLDTIPGQTGDAYYYDMYIYRHLYQNGIYTVGYSDNGGSENDPSGLAHVAETKCFYIPHYLKTPSLLDLSPYTTNLFSDNFTDGFTGGWCPYGGAWSITSGNYTVAAASASDYSLAKGTVVSDGTIEADVTCTTSSTGAQAGLLFRGSNYVNGADNYNGYTAFLKPGTGVVLTRSDANGVTTTLATGSMTITSGTLYHMKVVATGTAVQVYVANAGTPQINTTDTTYSTGGVGVRADNATGAWDNYTVTPATQTSEIENLTVAASSGKTNRIFTDAGASGGECVDYEATSTSDYVVYAVPIAKAGTYRINLSVKQGNTRGIMGLSIGSSATGTFTAYGNQSIDLYSPTLQYVDLSSVATVTFPTATTMYFKFSVTGKNASSSNYDLYLDNLQLLQK